MPAHCPFYSVRTTNYTGEACARGVFADQDICSGTVVESAHCLKLTAKEYAEHGRYTVLEHYLFKSRNGSMLLALGVGSLFNHSQHPNLDYRIDDQNQLIRYIAACDIKAEEELTIFYGDNLWFTDSASRVGTSTGIQDDSMTHDHMDDEQAFLRNMTV